MNKIIKVKKAYNSLDTILEFLTKETTYTCSSIYDKWNVRTDSQGQMEKCILIKKSGMHGVTLYFSSANELQASYVIPNALLNAYFGKNNESRKSIIEIITGMISNLIMSGSQNKAFEELVAILDKVAA